MNEEDVTLIPRRLLTPFWLGDVVYLKIAQDRNPGMITGVLVRPNGVIYEAQFEDHVQMHFDIELTETFVPSFE